MRETRSSAEAPPIGKVISANGHEIHIREDGPSDAPTIILIHGFLCSLRWFDRLVRVLSGDFRVIRADLLGHGFSSKPEQGCSPEENAQALSSAIADTSMSGATVIGHSMGADVAVAVAEQGHALTSLVVIDEGADYSTFVPNPINKLLRTPIIGRPIFQHLPESAARRAVEGFLAPGRSIEKAFDDPAQVIRDLRAVPYPCFTSSQIEKERFVAEHPLTERISALSIAPLVIFGERDRIYRCHESCEQYRAIPGARVEIIPEAGHSPIVEKPNETARMLRNFLMEREL